MKRIAATIFLTAVLFACVCMPMSADAASSGSQRIIVKNVYSSEFTALGTIPAYAENDYYYFIEDSNNHKAFVKYVKGEIDKMPADDFPVIRKGDKTIAYFFSAEKYREGYDAVLEFYNYLGTAYEGYLQLTFELTYSVDSIHLFFLEGAKAEIEWNSSLPGLTAYFGTENISKKATESAGTYSVSTDISKNGTYPLYFVNEVDDSISAVLTYSVEGYDESQSLVTAIICFVLVGAAIYLMHRAYRKPTWSVVKEERAAKERKFLRKSQENVIVETTEEYPEENGQLGNEGTAEEVNNKIE